MLHALFFGKWWGYFWWLDIIFGALVIYNLIVGWGVISNTSEYNHIGKAIWHTMFYRQTHFRLFDIFRVVLALPGFIVGIVLASLFFNVIPIFKKIFGFKLFKFKFSDED